MNTHERIVSSKGLRKTNRFIQKPTNIVGNAQNREMQNRINSYIQNKPHGMHRPKSTVTYTAASKGKKLNNFN